ncbi:hypothetical protein [Novosphingobium sp. SG751A]|uniref:hypothetical protein n=1 Tax=Novosphingobium sp. SG751A TaxID=2587000 RepID=UPI001551FDAF|nr:hypothetical protein [Novosphingobium sp. SG751A]
MATLSRQRLRMEMLPVEMAYRMRAVSSNANGIVCGKGGRPEKYHRWYFSLPLAQRR